MNLPLNDLLARTKSGPFVVHTNTENWTYPCSVFVEGSKLPIADFHDRDEAVRFAHAAKHIGPLVEALEAVLFNEASDPCANLAGKRACRILAAAKTVDMPEAS